MSIFGAGYEVVTSTTRPSTPATGQMIYETDTASFRWYTGSTWAGMIPVGTVQSYAGSTAPTGWLLCYGQALNAVSSPIYADLYAAIGTTYGGSANTNFQVPDLRGRAAAGKDDMGGSAASRITSGGSGITGTTLGASGGTETHTLSTAQLPSHNHKIGMRSDGTVVGNNIYNPASAGITLSFSSNGPYGFATGGGSDGLSYSAGSGSAHLNAQPTIILNYIIKY